MLYLATKDVSKITYGPVVVMYGLFVLAELCIIPTGCTFINQITSPDNKPFFMSLWQLGMGVSQWLALYLAQNTVTALLPEMNLSIVPYHQSFLSFAYLALATLILLVIIKGLEQVCRKKLYG